MADVRSQLGARPSIGTVQITLFVPSVDRDSQPINRELWCRAALEVLGKLFRGATAFPPGRGVWRDDDQGGVLVFDETVLVTSYAAAVDVTETALAELRRFLHRMGREARQGEVGLVIDGSYHGITEYDPE